MKANELRIGNWAMGNSPFKVDGNAIHMAQIVEKVNSGEERFGSIPLTEEILLKAGFEQDEQDKRFFLTPNGTIFKLFKNGKIIWRGMDLTKRLKYVHQLQNLYFALTGEELEITL